MRSCSRVSASVSGWMHARPWTWPSEPFTEGHRINGAKEKSDCFRGFWASRWVRGLRIRQAGCEIRRRRPGYGRPGIPALTPSSTPTGETSPGPAGETLSLRRGELRGSGGEGSLAPGGKNSPAPEGKPPPLGRRRGWWLDVWSSPTRRPPEEETGLPASGAWSLRDRACPSHQSATSFP